jgi:hypothetical protein
MARIPNLRDINTLIKELRQNTTTLEKSDEQENEKKPVSIKKNPLNKSPGNSVELWDTIIQRINGTGGKNFLKAFLKDAEPVSFEDDILRIKVPSTHKNHLDEDIHFLRDALKEETGKDIDIEIITYERKRETKLRDNSMVLKIKEIFNAEEFI